MRSENEFAVLTFYRLFSGRPDGGCGNEGRWKQIPGGYVERLPGSVGFETGRIEWQAP